MNGSPEYQINETTYQRCVGAFSFLHDRLGINIKVHDPENYMDSGQIFLFNHFARFETVIPQYLLYKHTGAYAHSIAANELFQGNEKFAKLLWSVGAVPNKHPGLLPFLAAEILRGKKIVVFPEGGMIKDRRVVDQTGEYSILSPSSKTERKHHKGAAAIAITLEMLKRRILSVHEDGDEARLYRWVEALGIGDVDMMIAAARKPTLVIPSNITFYPIRSDDNILRKGMDLFGGEMGKQAREELLIEGNILLKSTDMDIRFGKPADSPVNWNFFENMMLRQLFERVESLDDLFSLRPDSDRLVDRMISTAMARKTRRLRDYCMHEMYSLVSINLSHLASLLILTLLDNDVNEISHDRFHRLLYSVIKNAQEQPGIHLHRSIVNPEAYDGIQKGACRGFTQFIGRAVSAGLIEAAPDRYKFLSKLRKEHAFHETRLENPIIVYANEAKPVKAACRSIHMALANECRERSATMAHRLLDDECRAHHWCQETYSKDRHKAINDQETATLSGAPWLLQPDAARRGQRMPLGIVLVHGFLASPAELRGLGERLKNLGYPVLGVRLRGHGTSPWDLKDRSWQEWLGSVRRGHEIMTGLADNVCMIGFSTGGTLCLRFAAENPDNLAAVVAAAAPIKFKNKNLIFVPLIHGLNKITEMITPAEGVMPFQTNDSENPDINYRNIPISAVQELRLLVDDLKRRLPQISPPALILQGSDDPVVDPASAQLIHEGIGSDDIELVTVTSRKHGIIKEDINGTQDRITDFVNRIHQAAAQQEPAAVQPMAPSLLTSGAAHGGSWTGRISGIFRRLGELLPAAPSPPELPDEPAIPYPWEASYPEGSDWNRSIPVNSLNDLLDDAVTKYADHFCTYFKGKRYRYRDIGRLVNLAAKGFQQLGVGKGSIVGMLLPNCPYSIICFYAVLKAGGTVVHINPLYSRKEIEHQIRDSRASILVTLDLKNLYGKAIPDPGAEKKSPLQKLVVCRISELLKLTDKILFDLMKSKEVADIPDDDLHMRFSALINNDGNFDAPAVDPLNDIAVLQYTGGTTGVPKGAALTHANLYANVVQLAEFSPDIAKGQERILGVLPLFHAFGMTAVMNLGLYLGAEIILMPNFQLSKLLQTISRQKPSIFIGVPTMFSAIDASADARNHDLSSLKFCISGGAPLPKAVQEGFEEMADCRIYEGYGLSETSPVCTVNPIGGRSKPGSVGLPLPGTVVSIASLIDPARELEFGETGEICVSGPQVMGGYAGQTDEGDQIFTGGRLRTGDVGYIDEDGYLFVIDRIKEMILSGGFNVYPRMVEEEIYRHPAVADAAVIGMADAHRGEIVKAFIVLKPGENLTAAALRRFLKDRLAPFKIPRKVEFRESLPKTPIGKIAKKELALEARRADGLAVSDNPATPEKEVREA